MNHEKEIGQRHVPVPETVKERAYEKISPTAWGVAWRRTFTDIPYCKEIFDEFETLLKQNDISSKAEDYSMKGRTEITPFFEARYLLLNELVKQEKSQQIIELASGLTPRGLEFTEIDANVSYVEMDLPEILAQKEEIVKKILQDKKLTNPENLYFSSGNALKPEDLDKATSHFDAEKEITVIHEGLLRYLSHDEKKQLALAIKSQLKKFGGTWITPDIGLQGRIQKVPQSEKLAPLTGVADFEANLFASEDDARKFFEDLGFEIEVHKYEEVKSQLVSPERLQVDKEKLEEMLNWSLAFVMKIQS
jgi:O-methyltransferase involved in polyketide biosynthesis